MPPKPHTAGGYDPAYTESVRETCLFLATVIGDLLDDVLIVGGLVPGPLIRQDTAATRHCGTTDLDVGLALAVLNDKRYQALTERLRRAGFGPDVSESGNVTRQRWRIDGPPRVTVDFLIAPTSSGQRGGAIQDIEPDFAAIVAPGLQLAFLDRVSVRLDATTIRRERASRTVHVCGPAAFVVMKALAFRNRGEAKDAYDLTYLVQFHEGGAQRIAGVLDAILGEPDAVRAVGYLRDDFHGIDSLGPLRVAHFVHGAANEETQAAAWAIVQDLLDLLTVREDSR